MTQSPADQIRVFQLSQGMLVSLYFIHPLDGKLMTYTVLNGVTYFDTPFTVDTVKRHHPDVSEIELNEAINMLPVNAIMEMTAYFATEGQA